MKSFYVRVPKFKGQFKKATLWEARIGQRKLQKRCYNTRIKHNNKTIHYCYKRVCKNFYL